MKLENYQYKTYDNNIINYYEADSNNPILLIIHAQSANSSSYSGVIKDLSKKFHLIIIDCYGHGKSAHNKEKYNIINNLRKQTSVLVPIILVDSIFNTPFKAKTYEETLVALNNVVKETFEIAKTFPEKFFLTNCLTENPNSILMWSHYADKHTGFCIEYNFNQADSSITDHLVKVKYSNKLVHLKKSSLIQMLHIKTTPNYIKNPKVTQLTHRTYAEAITTKNTVWK